MRNILRQFHDNLCGFLKDEPIVVSYNKSNHELTYRQMNKTAVITYMKHCYLPIKNFKLGILTPQGYDILMKGIEKLMQDPNIDNEWGPLSFSINKLCLKVYKIYPHNNLTVPQEYFDIRFVNITKPFFVGLFIMRTHSLETKALYKYLKNEIKNKSKNINMENK